MRTPPTCCGGKQQAGPPDVALMPAHRVYLEPSASGAAGLFAKPRAAGEMLNDLDQRAGQAGWPGNGAKPRAQPIALRAATRLGAAGLWSAAAIFAA